VRRVLAEAKVRPHKVRGWLNRADDDAFWSQAGAVCRLYLDIPPGTLLVSVDEKTGIQARSRIRPAQPAGPGRDRRVEFEYKRHGTVSIVAAMDVATGQVVAERVERNDSAHFIRFLAMLDRSTDPALRIHLVMDNGSSHTSRATRAWLAAHPRFTVTHTPKHASWLNMVEIEIGVMVAQCLDRRIPDMKSLVSEIAHWERRRNSDKARIKWLFSVERARRDLGRAYPAPITRQPQRAAA
jgi:transposase